MNTKKYYALSNQILRSGTSIGANVEEALGGQSKKDFIAKISIAYKEARETRYRINLFYDSEILDKEMYSSLLRDIDEILRIIGSIQKTMKKITRNS